MKTILILIIVSLTVNLKAQSNDSANSVQSYFGANTKTSFFNIIANPQKYNGQKISLSGYLHFHFEENAIYMTKHDADYLLQENAVWFSLDENASFETRKKGIKNDTLKITYFDSKYVTVSGYFNYSNKGNLSLYIGTIEKIDRVVEDSPWYNGASKIKKNNPRIKRPIMQK